jgi:hypothetical protein
MSSLQLYLDVLGDDFYFNNVVVCEEDTALESLVLTSIDNNVRTL